MNNQSNRRRLAGRGLVAAALFAMPLTATISYADPVAPAAVAPVAPIDPTSPAPDAQLSWEEEVTASGDAPEHDETRTVIIRRLHEGDADAPKAHQVHKIVVKDGDAELTAEQREEMHREVREAMKEMHADMAEARHEMHLAFKDMKAAGGEMTQIDFECDGALETRSETTAKGPRKIAVCTSEILASALTGLTAARDAIAKDKSMSAEIRAEVLRSLDEEIKNWQAEAK